MEKAWQDTGMLAEAVLHAQAHGRPSLRNLVITWNKMLQKELDHTPTVKTDAAAAFLASLEDPKLTSLGETEKKPPIVILPPGMPPLSAPPIAIKKAGAKPGLPNAAQAPNAAIGAPMVQGASMVQGSTVPQGTPMVQGTPMGTTGAQGVPMNQGALAASQATDEAKPSESTVANGAPANAEATAHPNTEEAAAAPGNEEASSHDPATATAAPAADSSSADAPDVTPGEATVSAPSTEASTPPPASVSAV